MAKSVALSGGLSVSRSPQTKREQVQAMRASSTILAVARHSAHYTCPGGQRQGSPDGFREREELRRFYVS